jgi:hypothetical protein
MRVLAVVFFSPIRNLDAGVIEVSLSSSSRIRPLKPAQKPFCIAKPYVTFKGQLWNVPGAFHSERLAIRLCGADGHYGIFFDSRQLAIIDLTGDKSVSDVSEHVSALPPV